MSEPTRCSDANARSEFKKEVLQANLRKGQNTMQKRPTVSQLFTGVSVAGAIYLIVEIILHFFGTTICQTEGCAIVSQHTRFGDLSILLIGLVVFTLLSALALRRKRPELDRFINLILVVSLAAEGFFTGYQAFRIFAPCFYCLTILGLVIVLAVLRMLAGHREIIAGFASFVAVLSLFYLVLPAGGTLAIPADKKLVLFYSPSCKHCAEIMNEIDERKIVVDHAEAKKYADFLMSLGIDKVPTLFVNGPSEKIFLTGTDAIRRYLFCEPKKKTGKKNALLGDASRKQMATSSSDGLDLLAPLGSPQQILNPAADQKLCGEEQKCE